MANRAREVTEQLVGAREQARRDARRRAENLTREGRYAAADVLATLRRDFSALLADMEHLERSLRADAEAAKAPAAEGGKGPASQPGGPQESAPRPTAKPPAATTKPRARKAINSKPTGNKATDKDRGH
jgi:hypothetical protein